MRKLTKEEVVERARKVHGDKYDLSKLVYKNNKTKICVICPKHGEFWQMPYEHLNSKGCKLCRESKMEVYVRNILSKNNIDFEAQKRFEWLGLQSLDFYLPKYNIAIECQGIQHYKPVSFGSKRLNKFEMLDLVKKRDKNKKNACEEHDIKLLYFSDKQYEENVIIDENKLLEEINKL